MVSHGRAVALALVIGWAAMEGAAMAAGESVLLDFSAAWCGPCRSMQPVVDRLIATGHPVRRVDIDREPALASRFGVTSIPCFVMIADGRQVDRVVGVASYARLERMFGRAPDASSPPVVSASPGTAPRQPAPSPPAPSPPAAAGPAPPPTGPTTGGGGGPETNGASMAGQQRALQATVRIRVDDGSGQSYGSGTIVDARDGEALVLTCGHLFREAKQEGQITVDLFPAGTAHTVPGRLVSYDLERDLAFVSIRPGMPVAVARVAPKGRAVAPGDPVLNVGCDHAADPTARASHVTSIDRYQGPPNVEVAGAPVEGRSGGGLFDAQGQVIGVCFAADADDDEGLYAGLASIHAELDRLGLPGIDAGQAPSPLAVADAGAARRPPAGNRLSTIPNSRMPAPLPSLSPTPLNTTPTARLPPAHPDPGAGRAMNFSASERAALAEIDRRPQGTEVICIIRPANPDEKSEILVLRNVSPQFVKRLSSAERANRPVGPQLTSMETPHPTTRRRVTTLDRRPLLPVGNWRAKRPPHPR